MTQDTKDGRGAPIRARAPEEATLLAWDDLRAAIQRVECALPGQMTAAVAELTAQRRRFNDLMLGRPPAPTLQEGSG